MCTQGTQAGRLGLMVSPDSMGQCHSIYIAGVCLKNTNKKSRLLRHTCNSTRSSRASSATY